MATNILGAVISYLRENSNTKEVDKIFANDSELYWKMYAQYYVELYKDETKFEDILKIELNKASKN